MQYSQEQEVNRGMTDLNRNEDGAFKEGNNANPSGVNGHNEGWQRVGDRAQVLARKYTTAQIIEFGTDVGKRNEELSYWDAVVIQKMARALERSLTITDSGSDQVTKESECLFDRIEGKSAQPFVPVPDPLMGVNSNQKMLDMALKIAFILHQGLKVKGLTIAQPAGGITNDMESGGQATGDQVAGTPSGVR
jgi:hypothetical protein